jgi:anthranilate phosphoribosyltransferase
MEASPLLLEALKQVLEQRASLSRAFACTLLDSILDNPGPAVDPRLAALLGALAARGETEDELAGFVDSLRAHLTPIPLTPPERAQLIDTCGTGGDLSGTFNISTAAALVAAAAGSHTGAEIMVAKHGNRAVTSRSGSADVLEALDIPVDLTPEEAAHALRTHRFAFLPAPSLQPAMKALMPLRRALGVRTVFNILGPMTNPAGAQAQVLGVYAERLVGPVARTLAALGTRHAFVVHGSTGHGGGLDEFSLSGPTHVGEVRNGEVRFSMVTPEHFGLPSAPIESLAGGDAQANAAMLRAIFAGEPGPRRDVVVMNAAAVLVAAGLAENFLDGARLAQSTIDSGQVQSLVGALAIRPASR